MKDMLGGQKGKALTPVAIVVVDVHEIAAPIAGLDKPPAAPSKPPSVPFESTLSRPCRLSPLIPGVTGSDAEGDCTCFSIGAANSAEESCNVQ